METVSPAKLFHSGRLQVQKLRFPAQIMDYPLTNIRNSKVSSIYKLKPLYSFIYVLLSDAISSSG